MALTLDQLITVKDRSTIRAELLRQLQGVDYTTNSGNGYGTVTASGVPNADYGIRAKIMAAGDLGSATFQFSTDSGQTYSATAPVPGSGLYPLPGTGLTLVFANGPAGVPQSFNAGDVYAFATHVDVLPASAWQPFTVPLTLVENDAQALEEFSLNQNLLARGGYLGLASGEWLDLLVSQFYDLSRIPAESTQGTVTLTDVAGVGPISKAASETWVRSNSGLRFNNVNGYTIPLSGSVDVLFQAESPAASYNVGNNTITTFESVPGAGVTCNNPDPGSGTWITRAGADQESDASYAKRALARWPELGTGMTEIVYDKFAKEASPVVTRTSAKPSLSVAGRVDLVLAGAAGPVSPLVVAAVQAYLDPLVPTCVTVLAASAVAVVVTVTATIYVRAGALAQAQIDVAKNLDALIVGGVNSIGELLPGVDIGGIVYRNDIIEQIMVVAGVRGDSAVSVPAADVALTPTQVATLTQNLTFVTV